MGKYNFSAQKWAEIEQRLEALEQANNELRKENAMLRSQAKTSTPDRVLSRDIGNYDKAVALFAVPDDKSTGNNFATLYYAKMKMKGDADNDGINLTVG